MQVVRDTNNYWEAANPKPFSIANNPTNAWAPGDTEATPINIENCGL